MDAQVSTASSGTSPELSSPIAVGVDARGRSTSAVVWAADEAERSGRSLRLVTVHEGEAGTADPDAAHGLAGLARRLTLTDVSYLAAVGSATDVLLEQAADASLLVVGRRSQGPARRLLLGSTSQAVGARSPVPVVVVPESWIQPSMSSAPVVVGVPAPAPTADPDLDAGRADAVVGYAFDQARRLRVPLIVVSAWQAPSLYSWSPADVGVWRERNDAALQTLLAPWRLRHPHLEVVARSVDGNPEQALLDASLVSQLVVVGRHHGSRLTALTPGGAAGTTRGVLQRATRPVVVVPTGDAVPPGPPRRQRPTW